MHWSRHEWVTPLRTRSLARPHSPCVSTFWFVPEGSRRDSLTRLLKPLDVHCATSPSCHLSDALPFCRYATATAVTVLNKSLLTEGGFRYPFFMLAVSNCFITLYAFALTRHRSLRVQKPPWRRFLLVVMPIGLGTAFDAGFSNWSLEFVSISFHVILKGATPVFVFSFGLLMKLEKCSNGVPLALALIMGGLFLVASDRMTLPDRWQGLLLGILASFFSGLRWALSQLLMAPADEKKSPLAAAVTQAPCTLERPPQSPIAVLGLAPQGTSSGVASGSAASFGAESPGLSCEGPQHSPHCQQDPLSQDPLSEAPAEEDDCAKSEPHVSDCAVTGAGDGVISSGASKAFGSMIDSESAATRAEAAEAPQHNEACARVHPLGAMLYTSPVCALAGFLCSFVLEPGAVQARERGGGGH